MKLLPLTVLTVLLLGSGLGTRASAQTAAGLRGATWTLEQIVPRGEPIAIKPSRLLRPPTLKFTAANLISGSTGCNGYAAPVTVQTNKLKVGQAILKGTSNCPDALLGLETDFVDILEQATHFTLQGQRLTIFSKGGRSMTLRAVAANGSMATMKPTLQSLLGEWRLADLTWKEQAIALPAGAEIRLAGPETGLEFSGQAGCNQFFGTGRWSGAEATLSFSDLGSTLMLCEDMAAEEALTNLLKLPVRVSLTPAGSMEWRSAGGSARFVRKP